jgi:hypothetical protein
MATLPTNTFTNPQVSFYADLGAGDAGNELQSPASVLPDGTGSISLSLIASTGSGEADLLVSSTNGNDATITINSTAGGDATIALGQGALPGGAGYAIITAPGAVVGGGQIQIESGSGVNGSVATFDTNNNQVYLGQTTVAGLTTVRNGLLVNDQFVVNDPSIGIGLTVTSPATGVIAMSSNTGTLNLGSSSSNPDIIRLTDGGAADTGGCTIGQNGGTNVSINGGTVANPNIGANIRTDAASSGILTIGSSVANPTTMFVKDTGAAGTGFVDIAGGIPASIALRLQGSNSQVGSNAARVSTNNTAVNNPVLNISNSVDGTPAMVITSTGTTFNGTSNTITGDTTFTTGNCTIQGILGFNFTGGSGAQCGAIEGMNSYTSATVSCGDNGTASIPNPTDSLGGAIEAGLYFILGRNATTNNVPWQSVSTIGYWTGSAWVGGGGCCPALVSAPPSFLGIQGCGATLTLANGSGLGTANMIFYFRQIGGLLGMS